MEKQINGGAGEPVTVEATNMKTVMVCPYCNRSHRFDIRYGEGDVIWRRLRPAKTWMAPIFGKGEYTPTVAERCECGAMFIFARDPMEAIAGLGRRREGRRRPMSVEKTNVEIDGFTGYAAKRVIVIKKSEMTVARKYRAEFIRIVIPSEIPVREGVYAVYHDGDDLILRRVGEGLPPPPSEEAPTTPEQGIVLEEGVAEARGEEFETGKTEGTPLKVARDIPESVRGEAKEALEELP